MMGLGFVKVVAIIVEYAPVAISLVERILGKGNGAAKKAAASKEVLEFVLELVNSDSLGEWGEGVDFGDIEGLKKAITDEKEFVARIEDVNDAIVALANYLNSLKKD